MTCADGKPGPSVGTSTKMSWGYKLGSQLLTILFLIIGKMYTSYIRAPCSKYT